MTAKKTRKQRISPLTNAKAIGAEMRSIYRLARRYFGNADAIAPNEARTLAQILKMVADIHQQTEIEQRLDELERLAKEGKK